MNLITRVYGPLLLSGLVGSLGHCMGMCGPLVMMVAAQLRAHKLPLLPHYFLYHGARVLVYALLGMLAGGLGTLFGLGTHLSGPAGVVSLLLGASVILLGASYLGWLPFGRFEGAGSWLKGAMGWALRRGGPAGVLVLGALNGLLPCGLVYSALLVAATTGGPLRGALGMVLFGSGTLPALLMVGAGAGALTLSTRVRQVMSRIAGVLIIVVGLQLALRGMAGLGVVAHWRLGGLMIW